MTPKIIKTIQLKDTPAEKDYDGCGHSCLVLKNGVPQKLIYSPDRETPFSKSFIMIDPNNIGEICRPLCGGRGLKW